MPGDAASTSQRGFVPAREDRWQDDAWLLVVGSVDRLLRSCHGIAEFTDDPACVLRIALGSARDPVALSDGTEIRAGEPVGILHLWNERLRPYGREGPDLGWACDMRRRVRRSLQLLAQFIEHDPDWQTVWGFRADATLSRRLGNAQLRRVSGRYGFEAIERPMSLFRQLQFLGDCCNAWALTRAYNPAALARTGFRRGRCELWMSRRALLERYGRQASGPPARSVVQVS